MGKCYCDYCDVFLTNDSVAVRKQHNEGNRHKYNVCEYYRQHIANQLQEEIDDIVARFEEKVARGLIRPTYALPAPPKPPPVPSAQSPATAAAPAEKGDEAPTSEIGREEEEEDTATKDGQQVPDQVNVISVADHTSQQGAFANES